MFSKFQRLLVEAGCRNAAYRIYPLRQNTCPELSSARLTVQDNYYQFDKHN
jgi:hypothetical protein